MRTKPQETIITLNAEDELKELVEQYGKDKAQFDYYKNVTDKANAQIKSLMASGNYDAIESESYKASYIVQKRESMNEAKLLEILRHEWIKEHGSEACPWIKVKYEVDMDALENALYHNEFSDDVVDKIAECKEVKEVPTLRIKVKK